MLNWPYVTFVVAVHSYSDSTSTKSQDHSVIHADYYHAGTYLIVLNLAVGCL